MDLHTQRVVCSSSLYVNMGVLVAGTLSLSLLLLVASVPLNFQYELNPVKRDNTKYLDTNFALKQANSPYSYISQSNQQPIKASSSNYQQYKIAPYSLEESNNHYSTQEYSDHGDLGQQFSSIEVQKETYNDNDFQDQRQFLDTTGYKEYDSKTSVNLEGPQQLELIETRNYHKEVEPYETHDYLKHHHKEEEEHAEMHYHQHKHLHKHKHKQDHKHKHKEEHKHEHDHKHQHKAMHEHKHKQEHKHHHENDHKHEHKDYHQHKHKQEHKHDHHHEQKHEHKHKEKHQHEESHKHKHEEWSDHKHKHWDEHKHDHHHGHKHWNDHKHEHKHHNHHNHKHDHKHSHKQHYKHKH